jgi:cytochrome c-type biogenesis protein CcmH/NrfF
MGVLVFRCPASGETINSGVHTDESSLAKVRSLSVKLYCPVCQTMHLMRAGDGQVDAPAVPPPPSPLAPVHP